MVVLARMDETDYEESFDVVGVLVDGKLLHYERLYTTRSDDEDGVRGESLKLSDNMFIGADTHDCLVVDEVENEDHDPDDDDSPSYKDVELGGLTVPLTRNMVDYLLIHNKNKQKARDMFNYFDENIKYWISNGRYK